MKRKIFVPLQKLSTSDETIFGNETFIITQNILIWFVDSSVVKSTNDSHDLIIWDLKYITTNIVRVTESSTVYQ